MFVTAVLIMVLPGTVIGDRQRDSGDFLATNSVGSSTVVALPTTLALAGRNDLAVVTVTTGFTPPHSSASRSTGQGRSVLFFYVSREPCTDPFPAPFWPTDQLLTMELSVCQKF